MLETHAQIEEGVVVNLILVDPEGESPPQEGLVRVDELEVIPDIGATYDGEEFTPAPVEVVVDPLEVALAQINSATSIASLKKATAEALGLMAKGDTSG